MPPVMQSTPHDVDDRPLLAIEIALLLVLMSMFLLGQVLTSGHPAPGSETGGWAAGYDQAMYIKASRSWASLDFRGTQHWYPPGYALLAAPFGHITPWDRFMLPNLASLIAGQLACAAIARRFFGDWKYARAAGAGAFLIGSVGTTAGLVSWLMPWSTTPATAATFLSFLAVIRLSEDFTWKRALVAGIAVGSIVCFRPSDVIAVVLAIGVFLLSQLYTLDWKRASVVVAGCVAGGLAIVALAFLAVAATSGFGADTYYAISARIAFEPL